MKTNFMWQRISCQMSPLRQQITSRVAFLSSRAFSTSRSAFALENLGPAPGSTRQQNRVGRGPGGDRGKTSGRGQKGQKARHSVKPWFEGGQTPITRLFPKVGFRSKIVKPVHITLGLIAQLIAEARLDPTKPITMLELYRARAVDATKGAGVKILGAGGEKLDVPIKIEATRATATAIARIEELGGSFTAKYYNALGLRALTRPEATLAKYGRTPLLARPTNRRDIEFYRSEDARGYLVNAEGAPQVKAPYKKRNTHVSPLVAELEKLKGAELVSDGAVKGFEGNRKHVPA